MADYVTSKLYPVLLSSIGGFLDCLGLILMKLSHVRREKQEENNPELKKSCLPNWARAMFSLTWIVGFSSLMVGAVYFNF